MCEYVFLFEEFVSLVYGNLSVDPNSVKMGHFKMQLKTSFIATQGNFKMQLWAVEKCFQMLSHSRMLCT